MYDESAIDDQLTGQARSLRVRAESLRTQAGQLPDVLATAYRRRAAELELEATVLELQAGLPIDVVRPAA
ncbi:MAG: hypothetical protein MUF83_08485 [Acidimicrobiales bacterium]|jgi:hypothetical protein|nr:hypothetical protein [Acidimicrobiales bacterium]